ncbi:Glutamate synthase [NADPH] large chain [Olavius algarvensis spirochete endosymbiont]|uniref:nucleotidyltransferase family protein n=1 Tax=Olavius algarvensis spirochete endosymbiont TaxID=260710 RepID=UPI000F143C8C|nr:sugar phosphate nucleotidyltransferase [Olavius algarvensis spirochete endosymbiont]VDA99186.1 Glutamate synthase [NADPH] large chain [Olavius algarvensis spirochete endosymbiont]
MEATLIIMAAGIGSRYGGTKQIDPVGPNGEIILDYSVYDAIQAGFHRVVLIIRKDIDAEFRRDIVSRFQDKIRVDYVYQELQDIPQGFLVPPDRKKPWGTGHAILSCAKLVRGPFVVINADDFYGPQAFKEGLRGLYKLDPSKPSGFLVVYRLANTLSSHGYVTRGVCESKSGNLSRITERFKIGRNKTGQIEYIEGDVGHEIGPDELVSMNFWGFSPALLPMLESRFASFLGKHKNMTKSEFLIPAEIDALRKANQITIKVLPTDSMWFGVTYPEDKALVKASLASLVQEGKYKSPLW